MTPAMTPTPTSDTRLRTLLQRMRADLAASLRTARCHECGHRTPGRRHMLCAGCMSSMPLTGFSSSPYDNEMTRRLWLRTPVERCSALTWHTPHSTHATPVYDLKYRCCPEIGTWMGRLMGHDGARHGLFDDIDLIIPVPLTPQRERQRGYNQSELIARGVASECHLPVRTDIMSRTRFADSQTALGRERRQDNVQGAFHLLRPHDVAGRHVLLIDDVLTTGATACACAECLHTAGCTRVSVMTWGLTRE